jgi:hypothetical protein
MQAVLIYLSKLLLKLAIDRTLQKALPKIFDKIDHRIPLAINNGAPPRVIRCEIEHIIGQVTGQPVTQSVSDLVVSLYDPIKNAERTQRLTR